MKIDSHYKPPPLGNPPASVVKTPANGQAPSSAEVKLSEAAAQLSAADKTAPLNRAKIEEIKQAISEGRFKINPEAIADELIATSRQLLQSQQKAG